MVFDIFFYNQLAYALYFVFQSFEIFCVYLSVARLFTLLGNKFFHLITRFDGFLLNISLNLKPKNNFDRPSLIQKQIFIA